MEHSLKPAALPTSPNLSPSLEGGRIRQKNHNYRQQPSSETYQFITCHNECFLPDPAFIVPLSMAALMYMSMHFYVDRSMCCLV